MPTARFFLRVPTLARPWRLYSTPAEDLRARLMSEVKMAMKSRDTLASTTLRSVLSEVYAADKAANAQVTSATIANILMKAVTRRQDAVTKFIQASRQDLADKEMQESQILSRYLPPLLSEIDIDSALNEIINALPATSNPQKSLGHIFKEFYSKVEKSKVNVALVKQRAEVLLSTRA